MKKEYSGPNIEIIFISIESILDTSKLYFGDKIKDDEAQGEWIW